MSATAGTRPEIVFIVAVAENGVIGAGGAMPWRLKSDIQRFKAMTIGHAVIMGRKTHASIGRPLPGRRNIIVSRTADAFDGCELARSLEAAIALARTTDPEPRVIGGAQIYEEALPLATHIFLTEVHGTWEGDAFLHLDRAGWRETSRRPAETEGVEFVTLER